MTLANDISLDDQQHIVLQDVTWDFYERMLEQIGDGHTRVTFYKGRMEIMSPLPEHEDWIQRIGLLIGFLCIERNIPFAPLGQTTFRDAAKEVGLEPDACFYFSNLETLNQIKGAWDATVHPAPDLALEIDITRRSISKQPIYAALRVQELWRFDGKQLHILTLDRNGKYQDSASSVAFSFLPMTRFAQFLLGSKKEINFTAVAKAFREWLKTI